MTQPVINNLGVDCYTRGKNALISRLKKLKTTVSVEDGGCYHMDENYSQVHVDTFLTESELDDWLYKNNLGYCGTFERK